MFSEEKIAHDKVNKTLADDELEQIIRLDKRLGGGAHGNVFQGYDAAHGRFVAIKEIPYLPNNNWNSSNNDEEENKNYYHEDHINNHCVHTDCNNNNYCNSTSFEVHRIQSNNIHHNNVSTQDRSSTSTASDAASAIIEEIKILERACHPNLVRYYGARRSNVGVELIMEYVSGGSLEKLLAECGSVRECVARRYVIDVLDGLIYLHNVLHVCHRDIKPGNVLLTSDGQCKLTDFGVSKLLMDHSGKMAFMHTTIGTPWYMAPEVISGGVEDDSDNSNDSDEKENEIEEIEQNGENDNYKFEQSLEHNNNDDGGSKEYVTNTSTSPSTYLNSERSVRSTGIATLASHSLPNSSCTESTPTISESESEEEEGNECEECGYGTSADIWSLGVTLYEMVSGVRPFGHHLHNSPAIMYAITTHAAHPPQLPEFCHASWELQQFINLCLMHDPTLRPTAKELRSHLWIVHDHKRNSDMNSKMHECRESNRWAEPVGENKTKLDSGLQLLDTIDVLQTQNSTKHTRQTTNVDSNVNIRSDDNNRTKESAINDNLHRKVAKRKSTGKGGFCTRDGCFVDIDALH